MKKRLSALLALLLVFCLLFSACSPISSLTGEMDEDAAAPTETTTEPTETETEPTEEPAEPAETETEPTEEPAEPVETETEPTEAPAEPAETETEPTEEPAEPAETETEPTEEPAEPVETETEPTEEPTEPAEPVAEPEEPTPEPAKNVASVSVSDETTYYTSFDEAWTAANAAPATAFVVVTLLEDVTSLDGRLTVTDRTSWLVLDLNDHTLSRGLTEATESGEVFCLGNSGYVTIKNGTITGGNSTNAGGGIWVNSDHLELHLENLTVTGNNSANAGGGVYIEGCNADVFMTNVTITDNTCTGNGAGGVHWCNNDDSMAALTLGGKVTVYDNSASNCCDDFMAMTYPGGTCKLAFDGLSTDSRIGFAFEYDTDAVIINDLGDEAESLAGCFVSQAGSRYITAYNGSLLFTREEDPENAVATVEYNGTCTYYDDFSEAWTAANAAPATAFVTMTLLEDVTSLEGKLLVSDRTSWFVLDLGGHTINRGLTSPVESGEVFCLGNSGYVTIKNGTITGGNSTTDGGGIWVNSDHLELHLENLTITGNSSATHGGGIYIQGCNAEVFMTDVTITGNTCSFFGAGGVHWDKDGSSMAALTLGGKVSIYGNSASYYYDDLMAKTYPGGTCKLDVSELSTDSQICFSFENDEPGLITEGLGDKAERLAGCFVAEADDRHIVGGHGYLFLMKDTQWGTAASVLYDGDLNFYETCEEAWNAANQNTEEDCDMTLYTDWVAVDGSFGSGTGFYEGGLVPRSRGYKWLVLDLNGYTLDRGLYDPDASEAVNHANAKGWGAVVLVYESNSSIKICNGTITGGNSTKQGGGVYVQNNDVRLYDLTIKDNRTESTGGGIYVYQNDHTKKVELSNTTITGNLSLDCGGGVYSDGHGREWLTRGDGFVDNVYYGAVKVSNDVYILGNEGKGTADNVYLGYFGDYLYAVDAAATSRIGISKTYIGGGTILAVIQDADPDIFTSDDGAEMFTWQYRAYYGNALCR